MEKAKRLLSSADDDIPGQINQDLASTYLQLEPNFTAVSQVCAEKSRSLIQAMETEKVRVYYCKFKHNVGTVVSAIDLFEPDFRPIWNQCTRNI